MSRSKRNIKVLETIWECPDDLWDNTIQPILLAEDPPKATGRSRIDQRRALDGIIYTGRTGCQWDKLPEQFGDDSSVHRTLQRWVERGVFLRVMAAVIEHCADLGGVDWQWQSADGAMGKARLGGDLVGPNPTDRAKNGTKRSVIVEADGGPLGCVVAGANVHDTKLLRETIEAIVVERPDPDEFEQHLCLDKGYDNPTGRAAVKDAGYVPHIRKIGEEKFDPETAEKKHPARRFVVERTISWLNRWRGILVRYAKKSKNYLAMIQLAYILLWYRRSWRLTVLR